MKKSTMDRTMPDSWRFDDVKRDYSRECRLVMDNIPLDSKQEFLLPCPDVRGVNLAWAQRLPYGLRLWFEYHDEAGQNTEHSSAIYTTDAPLDPIAGDPMFGHLELV